MQSQTAIDPKFSVYGLVERSQKQLGTNALYNRRTMNVISYEIENTTMLDGAPNRIFSSFQYLSKFLRQADRYRKIAERAESVYVFGVRDVERLPQIPNLTYIELAPQDQLAREWFIVSYSHTFATILATEEMSEFEAPDHMRQFKGLWTFDTSMASIVQEWLSSAVGALELNQSEEGRNTRTQSILISNIMRRMTERITQRGSAGSMIETQEQLRIVIDNTLRPATA